MVCGNRHGLFPPRAFGYLKLFAASALELIAHYAPLGKNEDSRDWVSEMSIPPWFIEVLKRK